MMPAAIGPYTIVRELGRGAMGVVYLGHDAEIGRDVAIKVIEVSEDDPNAATLREALAREARAAGRLSHPGIVTIYQMGRDGGALFVAMEYVPGPTLAAWTADAIPHSRDETVGVLFKIAEALDYAHASGVVHRDIKPSNILMAASIHPKIADFGLAKLVAAGSLLSKQVMGTPRYISPEQIRAAQVDGRSDQFSLAVVAYEMLAGQSPFPATAYEALLFQILTQEPAPAHLVNPQLPAAASPILSRALSKEPARRFSTCVEFISTLQTATIRVSSTGPTRRAADPPPPHGEAPLPFGGVQPVPPKVEIWVPIVIVGLLIVGAAAVALWISNHKPGPPQIVVTHPVDNPPADEPHVTIPATLPSGTPAGTRPGTKDRPDKTASVTPGTSEPPKPRFDPQLTTALYQAMMEEQPLPAIEDLLRRGASPDGDQWHVPLMVAAQKCKVDAATLLLAKGANPDAQEVPAGAPLTASAGTGCTGVAALLLDHGAAANRPAKAQALVAAAERGALPVVRLLLDHDADPNLAPQNRESPLAAAAGQCSGNVVDLLLQRGARIDGAGYRGRTALINSAIGGCDAVMAGLLTKGARVNQADAQGKTALYYLVSEHSQPDEKIIGAARRLLDAGANPSVSPREDSAGVTPLMLATELWKTGPMYRLLLEHGADIKAVDGEGKTALIYAVDKQNPEAVEALLGRGAPVNVRDRQGMTALDHAKRINGGNEMKRIVHALETAGGVE